MRISPNSEQVQQFRKHRYESTLTKSSSMQTIMQGDSNNKNNKYYYIDALQRFSRNHNALNKEQREQNKNIQSEKRQKRMLSWNQRQKYLKGKQQENYDKMMERYKYSANQYREGGQNHAFCSKNGINPITLKYEKNKKGQKQCESDIEKKVNNLVRAHHIYKCSGPGYNILNGQSSRIITNLLPQNTEKLFQHKLSNYYSKFALNVFDSKE